MHDRWRLKRKHSLLCIAVILLIPIFISGFFQDTKDDESPSVQEYDWRVVRVFPHDTTAFTQGLIFHKGYLFESIGRKGKSEIRKIRLETGEIIQRQALEDEYFGEGLTTWNDRLIQLTLSSGTGFVYDIHTFEREQTFRIEGEGWGLTSNGNELIVSDGSSTLRFLNPETFQEVRRVTVTENGNAVSNLNELEMIEERIFANMLFSDKILIIDPGNGIVTGQIDLERLVTSIKASHSVNVLNGIAYDFTNGRIFITGKLWPYVYELKIWRNSDG